MIDGLAMGAGFTLALLLLGAIRELIGSGTLFGVSIFGAHYTPIGILTSPPGAFIVLGCLIALMQYFKKKMAAKDGRDLPKEKPAEETDNADKEGEV